MAQTVLVAVLDIPAAKFNDDRLERTLDALAPHLEAIWLEVMGKAFAKADIDLSMIFYDLTAFVAHGRYAGSELIDFGFAHNTPSNKRKFQAGPQHHGGWEPALVLSPVVRADDGPSHSAREHGPTRSLPASAGTGP
ncbi:MAG: DUF4277 domain-containing protein [Chloroflexi bacterium]|nr:DUF4277 domain-containing protein [Chloroflexota bacterium]